LQREEARGVEPKTTKKLVHTKRRGRSPKWSISNPSKTNEQQRCKWNQWEVAPHEIQMKTSENKSGTMRRLRGEGNEVEEEVTRLKRRWRRIWKRRRWRRTWKRRRWRRTWRRRKRKRKI